MRSVNRITLLGRLRSDPSAGRAGTTPVCNFELATSESFMSRGGEQTRTTLHTCVAFGPAATAVAALRAGDYLYVDGSMRAPRDGTDEYAYEVVCFAVVPVAEPLAERQLVGTEQEQ